MRNGWKWKGMEWMEWGWGRSAALSLPPSPHLQPLRDQRARRGQHGPPGVQQLVGAVLLDLLDGLAQAERVVAVAEERG